MKQRWYDKDPMLSLAISLIEDSNIDVKHKAGDFIIELAIQKGIVLPNDIKDAVVYLLRRWYDKDEILSQAMEYLRVADEDTRHEIAVEVIDFLQKV